MWMGVVHTELELYVTKGGAFLGESVCVNVFINMYVEGQKRVIDPLELDVLTDVVSHCRGAENQNQVL